MSVPKFVTSSKVWRLTGALLLVVAGTAWARTAGAAAGGKGRGFNILEIELSADPTSVKANRIGVVEDALHADFLFIAGYTLLLVLAVLLLTPCFRLRLLRTKAPGLLTAAALAAGLFDVIENCLLLASLPVDKHAKTLFLFAAFFAISKFVLLAVVLVGIFGAFVSCVTTPQWLIDKLDSDAEATPAEQREADETSTAKGQEGAGNIEQMSVQGVGFEQETALCFSGGGVRAASLSLGSLQELELGSDGLGWNDVKRITAVSGGAYMAGAWQLGRAYRSDAWQAGGADGSMSAEEGHLLSNLGYLASTWSRGHRGDLGAPQPPRETEALNERLRSGASVWATIFVGFVANLLVIASSLLLVVLAMTVAVDALVGITGSCELKEEIGVPESCVVAQTRFWLPPVLWLALGAFMSAMWVLVTKIKPVRLHAVAVLKVFKAATRGSLVLGLVLAVLLLGFPYLVQVVYRWDWQAAGGAAAGLAGSLGALVRVLMKRSAPLAAKLGGVAFIALLVLGSGWVAVRILALDDWAHSHALRAVVIAPAGVIAVAWLFKPELWSLNAFYRGKLRMAYAVRRIVGAEGETAVAYVNDADSTNVAGRPIALRDENGQLRVPPPDQMDRSEPTKSLREVACVAEPSLSQLAGTPLTICAAAHVTTRSVSAHYGIPAMSFTFAPDAVRTYVPLDDEGRFAKIECSTDDLEACYGGAGFLNSSRITTMFAVALAGAAVAPAMGRFQIGPTSALITFGNVRLGTWLPNPRYVNPGTALRAKGKKANRGDRFPKPRLSYLAKEFLGIHDPSDPYVYVSDGGHWENTGLVELLRPRTNGEKMPREVIAIDADPGDPGSVHQLSQAIDLAALECGVRIHIDLNPVRAFAAEPGGPAYARRSVALGVMRKGSSWGLLWYAKPVLSKDSPTPLLAHREIDAEFPHTSTVDQFFDTSTYVAYRDLGRFNAREVKQGRLALRRILVRPGTGVPERGEPYPGSWAVEDFRRLLQDFPESTADLVRGARKALGVRT